MIAKENSSAIRHTPNWFATSTQWRETETYVLGFDPSGNRKFRPLYQCPNCAQTYTRVADGDLIKCKGCDVEFSQYAAIEIAAIMAKRTKQNGAVLDPDFEGPKEESRKKAIEQWLYRNGFSTELSKYNSQPEPATLQDDNPWPENWDWREDFLEKQVEPEKELKPL